MQNSIQTGATIEYTPTADIAGGSLVVFPAMVGVAITDIAAGETGALAAEGVFALPSDGSAFAQGQEAYALADGAVTATAGEDAISAGKAWAAAKPADATVAVKINV